MTREKDVTKKYKYNYSASSVALHNYIYMTYTIELYNYAILLKAPHNMIVYYGCLNLIITIICDYWFCFESIRAFDSWLYIADLPRNGA